MPRSTPKSATPAPRIEIVSPVWLLKAVALICLAALLCSYLVLCLLFRQGQWQIVLHPVRAKAAPPVTSEIVRFGTDASGVPQLVGIWLPVMPGARYAPTTILFLPGGDGSRSDFDPTIETLHQLGLNVLAFDYRGYGFSTDTRPNQQKMTADAESAWQYLTTTRNLPAGEIIPYGTGVGASLATQLALRHSEIPALILDSPYADLLDVARHDPRASLIPARLLFRERFPLAEPLASLHTPKLLMTRLNKSSAAFQIASGPKTIVELDAVPGPQYEQAVTSFLDQYHLLQMPGRLMPTPTPSDANSH